MILDPSTRGARGPRDVRRKRRCFTRVNDPVDLDAGVVELFGEGVNSLQQVFTRLGVDVRPPGRDLD